jgi:hypothetical protein
LYKTNEQLTYIALNEIVPFTYDSKALYYKYFESFKETLFYDLKIAFWLLDPDRKDYSVEALVKKFNIKSEKSISFIQNYEMEDW